MHRTTNLTLALSLLALLGCAPDERAVAELTGEERVELCERVTWKRQTEIASGCQDEVLFFYEEGTPEQCRATVDECIATNSAIGDDDSELVYERIDCLNEDRAGFPATCTATVAQIEACVADLNDIVDELWDGPSDCDSGRPARRPLPPSCAPVQSGCAGYVSTHYGVFVNAG